MASLTNWRIFLVVTIVLVASARMLDAQEASVKAYFQADNASPLVGQPVNLVLTVEVPANGVVVSPFPDLKTEWTDPFMIKAAGERTDAVQGDVHGYEQAFVVVLWQAGDFPTPETQITYQLAGSNVPATLVVQPVFFHVPSVLDGTDMNLRPLKPPVWLPYVPMWVILAGGGGIAIVIVGGGALLRSRIQRRRLAAQESTPAQRAVAQLRRFGDNQIGILMLYPLVVDCLRVYVTERLQVTAGDMTTDELLDSLNAQGTLSIRLQKDLERLLRQSDLVKFARYDPGTKSAHLLLALAREWVENVEMALLAAERDSA
jgi:hypothetical protein